MKTPVVEHSRLKSQTAFGGLWTLLGQGFRFATTLLTTAVLARILTPEDFGLVAMALVVIGLGAMVENFGLFMAAIQAESLSEDEAANLFWLNLAMGAGLSLVTASLSPLVAWIYDDVRVMPILACLSFGFFFNGASIQHAARLHRRLALGRFTLAEYGGVLTGALCGISVALATESYWALVVQLLTTHASTAVYRIAVAGWLPGWPRRGVRVWSFLLFGRNISVANFFNFLVRNGDNFLLGKFVGPASLGLYAKAYQLLLLPVQQINAPVTSVFLPALSRLQDDPERFRRWYVKGLSMVAVITTPMVFGVVVFAEEIVALLLGEQWGGAVLIFRCLAPAALIGATNIATGWVYIPLGHVRRLVRWSIFNAAMSLLAMAVGLRWGAVGVACAVSASQVLLRIPALGYCYRFTPMVMGDFFRATWPPFAISGLAALLSLWVKTGQEGLFLSLAVGGGTFAFVVVVGYAVVPSLRKGLFELTQAFCAPRLREGEE